MASISIDFVASPTVSRFLTSPSFYNVLCGPRGAGKTSAAVMRTLLRAQAADPKYHPLSWACVRDTRKNIGLTVARTIKRWFPEPYARWRGKPEEPESCTVYVKNRAVIRFDFFGVNSPADHDRFQSYEASGGVWIEEPCPLATNTEFITSGVAESVLATAVTCLRASPAPTVQLTLNPPSADHWTAQLWHLPGYEAAGEYELEMSVEQVRERDALRANSQVFMMPPGENAAERETPGYVERNRQILLATGRTDLFARLVEGRLGYAQVGERVTPEFNGSHLAPGIQVFPQTPMMLAFDFGLNATCIAAQVSPQGNLCIHRAWTRDNAGTKQLVQQDVQPWLSQQPVSQWWYCGGPEAREREQSDSEESALRMIVRLLGAAAYRAGPVSWSARRDALRDALTRTPGGLPWVRVNPQGAALLVRALDGGWHYPTDAQGHVRHQGQPVKHSKWDHLGDAFAHLCAVLLRKTDTQSRTVRPQRPAAPRHMSYVPGYVGTSRTGA